MKKNAPIISAILIAISSFGFLLIPQIYDSKIKIVEDEISKISNSQTRTAADLQQAIHHKGLYYLNNDHLAILGSLGANEEMINDRKGLILGSIKNAAIWSLNGAQSSQAINNKQQRELTAQVESSNDFDFVHNTFVDYMYKAGQGTVKLDSIRKLRIEDLRGLNSKKNNFWAGFFIIQSMGLILSILSITILKNEKN